MTSSTVLRFLNALGQTTGHAERAPRQWCAATQIDRELGDDRFGLDLQPALERLIRSSAREAALNTIGCIAMHRHFVELLRNMKRMQVQWEQDATIAAEQIRRPVFITGLPRTGSTLLHALFALDREVRVPKTWEVMRPPVAHESGTKSRKYCARRLRWARRLAPEFEDAHPVGSELPEECIAIMAYTFRSIVFHTLQNVPSYQNWLEKCDFTASYSFHRRFLQYLQYCGAGGRWVLKAPGHMFSISALIAEYPDATIIQTHRDPVRIAASLASHTTILRSAFSDDAAPADVAGDWLERWWQALDRTLDYRESSRTNFIDVHLADLRTDPMQAIESLYGVLGWELSRETENRMAGYLGTTAKAQQGRHHYRLRDFGLEPNAIRQRVERYQQQFLTEPEPPR